MSWIWDVRGEKLCDLHRISLIPVALVMAFTQKRNEREIFESRGLEKSRIQFNRLIDLTGIDDRLTTTIKAEFKEVCPRNTDLATQHCKYNLLGRSMVKSNSQLTWVRSENELGKRTPILFPNKRNPSRKTNPAAPVLPKTLTRRLNVADIVKSSAIPGTEIIVQQEKCVLPQFLLYL